MGYAGLMRLERQLVHMLVAAITLIAAYLVPSSADAHGNHLHEFPAVSASELASAGRPDVPAVTAQDASASPDEVSARRALAGQLVPVKGCNGLCCDTGVACCLHALAPEAGGVVPQCKAVRPARLPNLFARPGIDPEALPKPPRTIA